LGYFKVILVLNLHIQHGQSQQTMASQDKGVIRSWIHIL